MDVKSGSYEALTRLRRAARGAFLALLGALLLACLVAVAGAQAAEGYTVQGTVSLQATALGLSEVKVTASEVASGNQVASARTALNGSYSLSLPAGAYDISYSPPSGSGYSGFEAADENVTGPETLNVVLEPTGSGSTFSGLLLGEGGVPLPGDTVRVGNEDVTTASNGEFSLTVAPGSYPLRVYGQRASSVPSSAAPQEFDFSGATIGLSTSVQENLTLPVHALTLRTLGSGGTPLSGALISGTSSNSYVGSNGTLAPGVTATYGEVEEDQTTGSNGTAILSLPDYPQAQTIDVVPPAGAQLVRTPVSIGKVAEDETREVQLGSGSTFSGLLLGEGGVPLPGDTVRVGNEDVTTASNGEFSLTVAPGSYPLRVYGQRASSVPSSAAPQEFDFSGATIGLSTSVQENLTLPVHALTLRTLGSGGTPLSGALISGTSSNSYVGSNGTLAPGVTATYGEVEEDQTTGSNGTAILSLPDYPQAQTIDVVPPAGAQLVRTPVSIGKVAEDETRIVVLGQSPAHSSTHGALLEGHPEALSNGMRIGGEGQAIPQLLSGSLTLQSGALSGGEVECASLGFGTLWNAGAPSRAHGQILGWQAAGHATSGGPGVTSECRGGGTGAYMSAETTLTPSSSTEATRGERTLPWNLEARCGERENEQVPVVKIGIPAGASEAGGSCESEAQEAAEVSGELSGKQGCYASKPSPAGCLSVLLIAPSLGLELSYGGTVRARLLNGAGNGLARSTLIFEGSSSGELQCQAPAGCEAPATLLGELKLQGYESVQLTQVK
jgi:hypothetical protein